MFSHGNLREITLLTLPKDTNRHRGALCYANLPAELTDYTYSFNNSRFCNCIRSYSLNRKHAWEPPSCRLYLRHSLVRFLGALQGRKKKLEEQYMQHSNDLVNVFKEWQDSKWDLVDNDLFRSACEHLDSGYHDLWDAWFSEEKGKEGYKALSVKCDTLRSSIGTIIADKIKDALKNKLPSVQLTEKTMSLLIRDIRDHVYHKTEHGYSLFYFDAEYLHEPKLYKLVTMRNKNSYYQGDYDLKSSSDVNINAIVEILNSILNEAEITKEIKSLRSLEQDMQKRLIQFRAGLQLIINTVKYEFKGVAGKCHICKNWKP